MTKGMGEKVIGGSFVLEDVSKDMVFTPEEFTEEHDMIAKTTEQFVVNKVVPEIEKIEEHQFDISKRLLQEAGELGLLGADVPEEYGGFGLDKISSAVIAEKFSRARSFSVTHGAHTGIGTLPIVFFGTKEQKETYLPQLAIGEKIAAYALTEPGSGSDALGAKTTAVLNEAGTHYVLNGEKQWITNSAFADVFVVYAKVNGEHFTAFIVERDYPGVSTGPEERKMGIKGSSTRTLILQDAMVPKEKVLGEIGKGHLIAFNILNIGRYKLAVGCIGGVKRSIELSSKYANERKQFKTSLANFTLIQEKIANMAIDAYAVESSVYRTVGLIDRNLQSLSDEEKENGLVNAQAIGEYALECSLNKFFASEALDRAVDEAVQIHGGYGFMQEYEVEAMYRDSRINRIFEGTNEINRLLVPSTLLRKAMKGELPLIEKATALQEELMMFVPEEVGEALLAKEKQLVKHAKKIFLLAAGIAVQKYEKKLTGEQELLASIADIVSDLYAMESALIRTEKYPSDMKQWYTEVFVEEAMVRIEANAKKVLVATEQGDMLRMMVAALRRLTRREPVNLVAKKRQIAKVILENESFVV
ncbi:acyl-CoA dehydrogenase family protein [Massilibacterium senegalense]|uniref:acyl-CoA dehydrogenase family protein n=1 Tax=Massilibacterium senegalense TaxID=1632858 RepID=UPI000781FA2E|nr:acyl-CoA dehydrogenase family protein [Massilibacterium senegalense]